MMDSSVRPFHAAAALAVLCVTPLAGAETYQHDAGNASSLAFVRGAPFDERVIQVGAFQWYATLPDRERITSLSVGWGRRIDSPIPGQNHDGTPFLAGIWEDSDDDPATNDLVLVSSAIALITGSLSDDLMTVDIPDVSVSGRFFVGAIVGVPYAQGQSTSENWFTQELLGPGDSLIGFGIVDPAHPFSSPIGVSTRPRWSFLRAEAVPAPMSGAAMTVVLTTMLARRRTRR